MATEGPPPSASGSPPSAAVSVPPAPSTGSAAGIDPAILEAVRTAVQQEVRAHLPASASPAIGPVATGGTGPPVAAMDAVAGATAGPSATTTAGELILCYEQCP